MAVDDLSALLNDAGNCDFDHNDGAELDGLGELDKKGVTRGLTEEAVRTARAALDVAPDDPFVPLHLGHALTWSGDRDGAVAAYEEALRRDPWEITARNCLKFLDALPDGLPDPEVKSWDESKSWLGDPYISPDSHGVHGFFLLRLFYWTGNNNHDHAFLLFDSAADVREYVDCLTSPGGDHPRYAHHDGEEQDEDDYEDEDDGLVLTVHQPGKPIVEYDLRRYALVPPDGGRHTVDWARVPLPDPVEAPLPPGRPLRINTRSCFWGRTKERR